MTQPAERMDSWWNPIRVRRMLENYASLCELLDDYGSPSGWLSDGHGGGGSHPAWANMVEIRTDLDRAIDALPPRLRSIANRRWRRCYDQSELAEQYRISQPRICQLLSDAADLVEDTLVRGVMR